MTRVALYGRYSSKVSGNQHRGSEYKTAERVNLRRKAGSCRHYQDKGIWHAG
jgi:hypothetical protein